MSGDFSIETVPASGLIRVRLWGFFELPDVARYAEAIAEATATMGTPPSEHRMVNDISDMSIQSQEVVAAFQRFVADPRYAGRRVAFVAASTLARTQLQRILGDRVARIFATTAEAEAWLNEPGAQAA